LYIYQWTPYVVANPAYNLKVEYANVPENNTRSNDPDRKNVGVRFSHDCLDVRRPPRHDHAIPIGPRTIKNAITAAAKYSADLKASNGNRVPEKISALGFMSVTTKISLMLTGPVSRSSSN
jgi:hypothetical protein